MNELNGTNRISNTDDKIDIDGTYGINDPNDNVGMDDMNDTDSTLVRYDMDCTDCIDCTKQYKTYNQYSHNNRHK